MALAHRVPDLRREVASFIVDAQRLQTRALDETMGRPDRAAATLSPASAALIATSLALTLNREADIGVNEGHQEALQAVAAMLDALEPRNAST